MPPEPQTRPVFFGDDWAELRDAQTTARAEAMARLAGCVCRTFLRAAVVMGRETDPAAIALRRDLLFDLRATYVAHDHLAGHWRLVQGHVHPPIPGLCDIRRMVRDWQDWALREASLWVLDQPLLLRRFALVIAYSRTGDSLLHELDLWDTLKEQYPLTPPAQGDFFDDPASYTPYR